MAKRFHRRQNLYFTSLPMLILRLGIDENNALRGCYLDYSHLCQSQAYTDRACSRYSFLHKLYTLNLTIWGSNIFHSCNEKRAATGLPRLIDWLCRATRNGLWGFCWVVEGNEMMKVVISGNDIRGSGVGVGVEAGVKVGKAEL